MSTATELRKAYRPHVHVYESGDLVGRGADREHVSLMASGDRHRCSPVSGRTRHLTSDLIRRPIKSLASGRGEAVRLGARERRGASQPDDFSADLRSLVEVLRFRGGLPACEQVRAVVYARHGLDSGTFICV